MKLEVTCPSCRGNGYKTVVSTCPFCSGKGCPACSGVGAGSTEAECSTCQAGGHLIFDLNSKGDVNRLKELYRVYGGKLLTDGMIIALKGKDFPDGLTRDEAVDFVKRKAAAELARVLGTVQRLRLSRVRIR